MLYEKNDLFSVLKQNEILNIRSVVCTTNCTLKKNGELVAGKGIALAFARKWPDLPIIWGKLQKEFGEFNPELLRWDSAYYSKSSKKIEHLIIWGLPTKIRWQEPSTLKLVEQSVIKLVDYYNKNNYQEFHTLLPKLGCSNGGLLWESVQPIMEKYLDDRFVCCLGENLA